MSVSGGKNMPIIKTSNHDIFYVDEGDGFPIFLIHGLAGDHKAWLNQIEYFKNNYRVIAVDNPGSGKSSSVSQPCTTKDLANTMLEVMESLSIDKAHIVGRSLGGFIGQQMVNIKPEFVKSLVISASAAKVDPIGTQILKNMKEILEWRDNWTDWARHSNHLFFSPDFFNNNPDIIKTVEAIVGDENRSKESYLNLNDTALAHDFRDSLGTITCPTLIMAGLLDPICSIQCAYEMKDNIPGSELVVFEKSSHFLLVEEYEKAIKTLDDWFNNN